MHYFKNNNNEIFAYDDEQVKQGYGKDLEEILNPILNGKVLVGHKNINQVETKEDGSYYNYYLENGKADIERVMAEDKANTLQAMEQAIQSYIDNVAISLGYDNISSIGKYLGYDNPFRAECEKLGSFNASCWVKAYEIQSEVEQGLITMPTVEEVLAEMPIYVN